MSLSYPSDIGRSNLPGFFPRWSRPAKRTKPRTVDLYDVFCGVLYLLKAGASGGCSLRTSPIGALATSISAME